MKLLSFFYVLVYGALAIAIGLAIAGCDGTYEVNPNYNGGEYTATPYEVFSGTVDGQPAHFRNGAGQYTCGTDNLVYEFDTNAAYLNADSTQASCDTLLFTRYSIAELEQDIPLVAL